MISRHANRTCFWYLLEVISKVLRSTTVIFIAEHPPLGLKTCIRVVKLFTTSVCDINNTDMNGIMKQCKNTHK